MARSWVRDPLPPLEALGEAADGTPGTELPSHAPVLERPTLLLLLGSVPEGEIGTFGSGERVAAELALIAGFAEGYASHLSRGGQLKPGEEGKSHAGYLCTFRAGDEHTLVRLGMVDAGSVDIQIPGREHLTAVRVRQGPPRLSSSLVRVIVQGLHEDLMVPGVVASLLESAGYAAGGEQGFVLRAEHAGEQRGDIAAIAPDLGRCGVIVGIVRPPSSDPTLSRLPKTFQDSGAGGVVRITVSHHHPVVPPPPVLPTPADPTSPSGSPTAAPSSAPPAAGSISPFQNPPPTQPPSTVTGIAPQHLTPYGGHSHPAAAYQPSSYFLPFPPPPPPPRCFGFIGPLPQSRGGRLPMPSLGRWAPMTPSTWHPTPHSSTPCHSTVPLTGFTAATDHSSPRQLPPVGPLTRALDPILDLGAHLPGDHRGIGRFPSPPRGLDPQRARFRGRTLDTQAGRGLGAIGPSRERFRGAAAYPSGWDIVDHDMGVLLAPPGFPTPLFASTPSPHSARSERSAAQAQPMEIDQGGSGTVGGASTAGGDERGRTHTSPSGTPPLGAAPCTEPAGPSRMEIDLASTRPALPDSPLIESSMAWLQDNEDPARNIEERRQHLRRLVQECPSVYARHAQDGSNPPPPEVRTALRELGGLMPAEGDDDPVSSFTSAPPLVSPAAPPPSQRRAKPRKGAQAPRGDGPAAAAGHRTRQDRAPWFSSSRLPCSSPGRPQSQPTRHAAPPSGSRRQSQ
jgi:hypothetical protein